MSTCFKMLCENCGVLHIRAEGTCHDQDGLMSRNSLEFVEKNVSEPVTEHFVLIPSARVNGFRRIDDEMVVDKSGVFIPQLRL